MSDDYCKHCGAKVAVGMKACPGQMALDLFPAPEKDRAGEMVEWLVTVHGCDHAKVEGHVRELARRFGFTGMWDRGKALVHIYGKHAVPSLQALPPVLLGVFDASLDYHTVWDRCWAARQGLPLREVMELRYWDYGTGAYETMDGRKVPGKEEA